MIIYLDESKKLSEWKIAIWWFITEHNNHYINRFIENKKIEYWLENPDIELKSIRKAWKVFYENILKDEEFKIISRNIVWVNITWYYKDNFKQYIEIISLLISKIYIWIRSHKSNITIISDFLIFWRNTIKIEKEIVSVLNKKFPLYKWYKFRFVNSKKFQWVQLADLISYQLRLVNINREKLLDDFLLDNNFNIDLTETTKI